VTESVPRPIPATECHTQKRHTDTPRRHDRYHQPRDPDPGPLRRHATHPRLANRRTHRHGPRPNDANIDPDHVAHVLRGLYYETALAGSRNSLLPTLEVTTPDHILFGTDWPSAPEPTAVRNIDNLTNFDGFTPAQLRAVERDNALKLFPRFA